MKALFNLSFGFFMLLFTATCSQNNESSIKLTGKVQQQGITSYQYGSHTLSAEEGFYALTSEKVDLDNYVGQEITVKAEKIEGYPVEGGPEYLRVLEVIEN